MERVQQVVKYLITLRTTHVCKYRICGIWIHSTTGEKRDRTQKHRYYFQALHRATSTRQTQIDWKQSGGRPCIGKTSTGDIIPYHHDKLKGRCNNCNALFFVCLLNHYQQIKHYTVIGAKAKENTPNITPYIVGLLRVLTTQQIIYIFPLVSYRDNKRQETKIQYHTENHITINTTIPQ